MKRLVCVVLIVLVSFGCTYDQPPKEEDFIGCYYQVVNPRLRISDEEINKVIENKMSFLRLKEDRTFVLKSPFSADSIGTWHLDDEFTFEFGGRIELFFTGSKSSGVFYEDKPGFNPLYIGREIQKIPTLEIPLRFKKNE